MRFDPAVDRLWLVGDLVNRGPASLAVLRFVRGLGDRAVTVLGNHDLHLVARRLGARPRARDTFDDVLRADDCDELLAWLRTRPLLHAEGDLALVHAGLPPQWSLIDAIAICAEASHLLADADADDFFRSHMYGNEPDRWTPALAGWERLRFVINCCTRLRVCTPEGHVDLRYDGPPGTSPEGRVPWFAVPGRRTTSATIVFGHWSALGRVHWPEHNVYGLDTGCVWGRTLTALRLEDGRLFAVESRQQASD